MLQSDVVQYFNSACDQRLGVDEDDLMDTGSADLLLQSPTAQWVVQPDGRLNHRLALVILVSMFHLTNRIHQLLFNLFVCIRRETGLQNLLDEWYIGDITCALFLFSLSCLCHKIQQCNHAHNASRSCTHSNLVGWAVVESRLKWFSSTLSLLPLNVMLSL